MSARCFLYVDRRTHAGRSNRHLVWAIVVLIRNNEQEKITFHRFSVIVWAISLIPYAAGAAVAMAGAN